MHHRTLEALEPDLLSELCTAVGCDIKQSTVGNRGHLRRKPDHPQPLQNVPRVPKESVQLGAPSEVGEPLELAGSAALDSRKTRPRDLWPLGQTVLRCRGQLGPHPDPAKQLLFLTALP